MTFFRFIKQIIHGDSQNVRTGLTPPETTVARSNFDLILVRGAPGVGKSTLTEKMKACFPKGITIEVDSVREMINRVEWMNGTQHLHALQSAWAACQSYANAGYSPVIVIDTFGPYTMRDFVSLIDHSPQKKRYIFISLFCEPEALVTRITGRKNGFSEIETSLILNEEVRKCRHPEERMIDTTGKTPDQTLTEVLTLL
jgi:predicted ABC-type ATPase